MGLRRFEYHIVDMRSSNIVEVKMDAVGYVASPMCWWGVIQVLEMLARGLNFRAGEWPGFYLFCCGFAKLGSLPDYAGTYYFGTSICIPRIPGFDVSVVYGPVATYLLLLWVI